MVRVAEVALLGGAEPGDRGVRVVAEQLAQLGERPHVEASLDALGVGVERAVEAALRAAHLAQRPLERVAADLAQPLVAARPASRAGRRGRAGRCRRASSRSAGPSRRRRRCSGRSRRRAGRGCRRRPSRAASAATSSRSPRSSRNSMHRACGNFGAPPKPPLRASKALAQRPATASLQRALAAAARLDGCQLRARRRGARAAARRRRGSPRGSRSHASAIACSTCVHAGIPWRGSGGK